MSDRPAEKPSHRLHGFVSGFHATYYVYTGVECGLFEALVEPRTPAELAGELGLHGPYVRQFCETGLRWGLLEVEPRERKQPAHPSARFRLDERFVDALAVPESPRYMGGYFRFLATHQSKDYESYPTAFEASTFRKSTNREPAFTEGIEASARGLQDVFLNHLVPELPALESRLARGGRLLDVGCGTGRLACRLCEQFPNVEAVGVDIDEDAVTLARERADREGLADRTSFRQRDATEVDGAFEVTVLFMSLHELGAEKRHALFERLRRVLTDDGVIVVFDHVYPERSDQFDRRPFAAGVETQWAELTWGADVPTRAEHRGLLETADRLERSSQTVADRFLVYEGVPT